MNTIYKSRRLRQVRYDVRGPVLEAAEALVAAGADILRLNTGNPAAFGFSAPEDVLSAFAASAREAQPYAPSKGILPAREAIARHCAERGIPGVGVEDVFIGNGVSEMISIALQALLDDGDEVLLPSPDYPLWTAATVLCGGVPVHYRCDESAHWYPDIADIRRRVTARTKAMVIINPNNPTGALYPRPLLEQMVQIARENGLVIFSDEIYDTLVMDGREHIPTASLAPDLFTVTMNGLSKSHCLTGYRAGWMCLGGDKRGAADYIHGLTVLASMRLCSNVPAQHAIAPALASRDAAAPWLRPGGRLYKQRELITRRLNAIPGVTAVKPAATFYIFPRIDTHRFGIVDDERFTLDFLRAEHILLVAGTGFNWGEPDHFRLVYLPEEQQLDRVSDALERFLGSYRQTAALRAVPGRGKIKGDQELERRRPG